jgi:toxin CcdB
VVRSRTTAETFVIYQSDFVARLSTRLVVPLIPASGYDGPPILRLNPILQIDGEEFVARTDLCFAALASDLQSTGVSVEPERDAIRDAFDFLTTGF